MLFALIISTSGLHKKSNVYPSRGSVLLRFNRLNLCFFSGLLFCLQALAADLSPRLAEDRAGYADAASCLGCHGEQSKAWKGSDHDWAMRVANADSVLGNFNDSRFEDAGVTSRFFRKNDKYFVNTEGADGKLADFEISYTFGFDPLQQYLVAFPGGRLQSLTIAWDSRPQDAGGQRWFSMYPGQRFSPDDALHWTGRYQNWNAMCADCHSTNLLKNYDDQQDTFSTTWQEQNVGCQSCHGPGQKHLDWASQQDGKPQPDDTPASAMGLPVDFKTLGSQGLVEQCGYCHSRRQSLGVGQQHGKPLLDAVLPVTLRADLYHADGQIQGEVYEYSSFVQSKMFAAGVSCVDCHDPHTTKLKLEGNALCLQCHNAVLQPRFPSLTVKTYDNPEHHHHQPGTAGAQCVNCHMPAQTYMLVDPRRDHSIRVPRPDLNANTASPDACTACHKDQSPEWAASAIEGWTGKPQRPAHYGESIQTARQAQPGSLQGLAQLIGNLDRPAIVRASAAEQLASAPAAPVTHSLRQALKDDSALVRAYAIAGFAEQPSYIRVNQLLPLLRDPVRAVRDETLRALASVPPSQIPEGQRTQFQRDLADYERRLRGNADLPGGRLTLAVLLERQGRQQEALDQYHQTLKIDPYFAPARVNLVTLANRLGRQDEAEKTLRDAMLLSDMPLGDRGNLAYLLALLLIEQGQAEEAVTWLDEAATALPENSRIRYNQGLLLLQLQQVDQARIALEAGLQQSPDNADLLYALVYLYGSTGQLEASANYVRRLQQAAPDDPRLPQLLRQLNVR